MLNLRFGIALGGGGARGAAHVGVLKALEENNIYPSSLSGASAGAIIAGLYASGFSVQEMEDLVYYFSEHEKKLVDVDLWGLLKMVVQLITTRNFSLSGLLKGNYLEKLFYKCTQGKHIKDLTKTLSIPAVDLNTGSTVVFSNALSHENTLRQMVWRNDVLISEAMRASSAYPSVFQPKKLGLMRLADGGITDNLPVNIMMAAGEKNVLSVDLSEEYPPCKTGNMIEVVSNTFTIMRINLLECTSIGEKLNLRPKLPPDAGLLSFSAMPACMDAGYQETTEKIPVIKRIFNL